MVIITKKIRLVIDLIAMWKCLKWKTLFKRDTYIFYSKKNNVVKNKLAFKFTLKQLCFDLFKALFTLSQKRVGRYC